ncbi:Regulatory protein afsR [Actinoplanes sp. SE50]|uniref:AfsR/SARP family transcriptional regulator n=1 Tax=unclassified Actinoplanes TaxID=2626549 RepID=UPI00023EC3DE|nr:MULTISPECIES: BTAD domain-containing putative transcriptional regulator [unclassified Actinoplanes]AEV81907.1 Regulatory protein afsR [Actinoplanes sp. SE50/110]ATO80307.1 Regulatory protein afsR [Actinoplanes sp. SE50]SLL97712.1 SARP family transcriptional regulator [Actinoplanes sp. SE50/110]
MNDLEFRVLGPVEVWRRDRRVMLPGSKITTVLAALLLARGKVVPHAELSALLWGWDPPATVDAQIYTYVSRLRKRLDFAVRIVREHAGYTLDIGDSFVDLFAFEELAARGAERLAQGHRAAAADDLRGALALWRGPALANVTEPLGERHLPWLDEAYALACERRAEAELELGGSLELVPELTELVARYPLREQFRAQLVLALHRAGRRSEALVAYDRARRTLADQLGVGPGEALTLAYQEVLISDTAEPEPAPVRAAEPVLVTLPPDEQYFVGRADELAGLERLLTADRPAANGPRQVLLTGAVGTGKTALAVRAAHRCAGAFGGRIAYASLTDQNGAPLPAAAVLKRLLYGLGEPVEPGCGADELGLLFRAATARRPVLVILDDVPAGADLAALTPNHPAATLLLISRATLTVAGRRDTVLLEPMRPAEGIVLLAAVAGEERILADLDAARAVVGFCDALPAALRICGARLAARPLWSVRRLAHRLTDPARRLDELALGDESLRGRLLSAFRSLPDAARRGLPMLRDVGPDAFTVTSLHLPGGISEAEKEQVVDMLVQARLVEEVVADDLGGSQFRMPGLMRLLTLDVTRAAS